jgi:hypothetical protein
MNGSAYAKPDDVMLRYSEPAPRIDGHHRLGPGGLLQRSISVVYKHIRYPLTQPSLVSRSGTAPSPMSACYVRWI